MTPKNKTEPFLGFPKIARFNRPVTVTEKIDGTNSQIYITEDGDFLVGSRKRWITPEDDNYGFAAWAHAHKKELMQLGPGSHFGEWWGAGIQRKYGLVNTDKRFSMFNVIRWCLHDAEPGIIKTSDPRITKMQTPLPACVGLAPILWVGKMEKLPLEEIIDGLKTFGSQAVPGFMNPEGVVIYHAASNTCYKKTLLNDDEPKSRKQRKEMEKSC